MSDTTIKECNLPADGNPHTWTDDEWKGMAVMLTLIIKHLPDDFDCDDSMNDCSANEVIATANKAVKEGRMPQAFYDELLQSADERRGGRVQ